MKVCLCRGLNDNDDLKPYLVHEFENLAKTGSAPTETLGTLFKKYVYGDQAQENTVKLLNVVEWEKQYIDLLKTYGKGNIPQTNLEFLGHHPNSELHIDNRKRCNPCPDRTNVAIEEILLNHSQVLDA